MTNDIEEQVAAHIREILHLALDVKGMTTLRKLNELSGQTSKCALQITGGTNSEWRVCAGMELASSQVLAARKPPMICYPIESSSSLGNPP